MFRSYIGKKYHFYPESSNNLKNQSVMKEKIRSVCKLGLISIGAIGVLACLAMASCKTEYGGEYEPISWRIDFDSFIGPVEVDINGYEATVSCGAEGGSVILMLSSELDMDGYTDEKGEWVYTRESAFKNDWCEVRLIGRVCTIHFAEDNNPKFKEISVFFGNFMCTRYGNLVIRRHS